VYADDNILGKNKYNTNADMGFDVFIMMMI
jgi:hypothetical protein